MEMLMVAVKAKGAAAVVCHLVKVRFFCRRLLQDGGDEPKKLRRRNISQSHHRAPLFFFFLHFYITKCFITCQIVKELQWLFSPAFTSLTPFPPPSPRLSTCLLPGPGRRSGGGRQNAGGERSQTAAKNSIGRFRLRPPAGASGLKLVWLLVSGRADGGPLSPPHSLSCLSSSLSLLSVHFSLHSDQFATAAEFTWVGPHCSFTTLTDSPAVYVCFILLIFCIYPPCRLSPFISRPPLCSLPSH